MEYEIEQLDRFKLLGKAERQWVNNVKANLFWEQCKKDGTLSTLTSRSSSPRKEYIGIADGSSYDGESYWYYIMTPYDKDDVPEGYLTLELPAGTWVKFPCAEFHAKSTAEEELYRKIYAEFFPSSGYEPEGYQLEVYPSGDGDYPDTLAEIWIAARKK